MAFRNAHPALRPADFFKGKDSNRNGLKDITWLRDDGKEAGADYLNGTDNRIRLTNRIWSAMRDFAQVGG